MTFFRLCSRAPCTISLLSVAVAAARGSIDADGAREILAGERRGIAAGSRAACRRPPAAAQPSGAGSEIDDVVGALDGLGIVLHHQHGVAEIAQAGERIEQPIVIARVQSDGRLVQNVQHAAQLRADLRGQTDALRFAARERGGGTRQAQIVEADRGEELQAIADLFDHAAGDLLLALVQLPGFDGGERAIDGHLGELRQPRAFHAHRQTAGLADGGRGKPGKAKATCSPSAIRDSRGWPLRYVSSRILRMPGNPLPPSSSSVCVLLGQLFERFVDLDAQPRGGIRELLLHVGRNWRPGRARHRAAAWMDRRSLSPGSKLQVLPSPWQVSHAPNGLLNENERGSSCGTLVPQLGHASFCEYSFSSPLTTATITSPLASLAAVSMEASRRFSEPGLSGRRSTTTSMV